MILWGVNAINHDASLTVFKDGVPVFASHSERFSKQKNDITLNKELINYALNIGQPEQVVWSEKPILKKVRQLYTRDDRVFDELPKTYLKSLGVNCNIRYVQHHKAHAAAAAFTSPFKRSLVFIFDGIGEFDTISVWKHDELTLTPVYKQQYPHSLGLFYSAFTRLIGLKSNEEEFILMGMAAYGQPIYRKQLLERYFDINYPTIRLKENLYYGTEFSYNNIFDLAASVQAVYEEITHGFCKHFKQQYNYEYASFSGGCSLNCLANARYRSIFTDIWVFPNSGDAGNSYGAGLSFLKQKQEYTPYLGYNIERNINIDQVVDCLKKGEIIGIANGKAEFGPRALGNRSLIADPRSKAMQVNVNIIKRRERFRPFAPAVLEEHFNDIFITGGRSSSRFMTQIFNNRHQSKFPGITHMDGTSRVQTVSRDCNTVLRPILLEWYRETGIPLLLNTSLNIKGQPLINNLNDVSEFSQTNNIRVF